MKDWDALCATVRKENPNHWASIYLACTLNHLGAALLMAGVTPGDHEDETTVPNEPGANLQEVWCAYRNAQKMLVEIGRQAREALPNGGASHE